MLSSVVKIFYLIASSLLFAQNVAVREFFDDFNYTDSRDTLLHQRGWTLVDGKRGPPEGAQYSQENIIFAADARHPENRNMYLLTSTTNTRESMRLARIETAIMFHEGTYAARIFFDNSMRKTQDANIQTFYAINRLAFPGDSMYSECDIEYLPFDVWNTEGNTKSKLYLSTWETYREEPWFADHAVDTLAQHQAGWHILLFQVTNGNSVKYYIDNKPEALVEHCCSPMGSSVYPESPMQIAFANWIFINNTVALGKSTISRTSRMGVDWVYHIKDSALSVNEVKRRVRELQKQSVHFIFTIRE